MRNYEVQVRVARFHNIFGPAGNMAGGSEKAPAAICRKVAEAPDGGTIEIWGDGMTDSLLSLHRRMSGRRPQANGIRSSADQSTSVRMKWSRSTNWRKWQSASPAKERRCHISGPLGVRGRNSDNRLIREKLELTAGPSRPLREGLRRTYEWVSGEVRKAAEA